MSNPNDGRTKEQLAVLDHLVLGFGKYRSMSPSVIAEFDPSYIVWMYETISPRRCSEELYIGCRFDLQEDEANNELFPGDPLTGRLSFD